MFGNNNAIREYFSHSDRITCIAAEPITGKTFVKLAPNGSELVPRVAVCGPGERPYGVAGSNASPEGRVTIFRVGVLSVTAGEQLTSGTSIAVGPAGTAVAAMTATVYGDVHADAEANAEAAIALSL